MNPYIRQELNGLASIVSEMKESFAEQLRERDNTIEDLQKQINRQDRKLDELQNDVRDLERRVERR